MNLKELRQSLRIKQTHAAQICRTSQSEYSRTETGRHPWRQDEFKQKLIAETTIPCMKISIEKQGI